MDLIQGASSAFTARMPLMALSVWPPKILLPERAVCFREGRRASAVWRGHPLADAIKNDAGKDVFGYKLNFFYLRADDWLANNYDRSRTPSARQIIPADLMLLIFMVMNIRQARTFRQPTLAISGLGVQYRTGYREERSGWLQCETSRPMLHCTWDFSPKRGRISRTDPFR